MWECCILPNLIQRERLSAIEGCPLPLNHDGDHLCLSNKGWISWSVDHECDCCTAENRECEIFEYIGTDQAEKRIQELAPS